MSGLVLSLFPGIGLLDMAFEEEGFCVVRGPDLLWGGDVQRFHPPADRFDGVIGGPPCQSFSTMKRVCKSAGVHGDQIPEFERCIKEARPGWFLMENVQGAPLPSVPGYAVYSQLLRDHWCGGETMRLRRFSFGSRDGRQLIVETLALHRPDPEPAALASGGNDPRLTASEAREARRRSGKTLGNRGFKTTANFIDHCRLQGLPKDFDIPPFKVAAKVKAVGNGVPIAMGRAVARAVKQAAA